MSASEKNDRSGDDSLKEAFVLGRNSGIAIAAVTMSLVAFLNLLGMEKSIVAVVFGIIVLKNSPKGQVAYKMGKAAVMIGILHILTVIVVVTVYWNKINELIELLMTLS